MTADQLDAILTVARRHQVTDLELPGIIRVHILPKGELEEASPGVMNAGGWKRGPNLDD